MAAKTPEIFSIRMAKKAPKRVARIGECDGECGDTGGGWYEC